MACLGKLMGSCLFSSQKSSSENIEEAGSQQKIIACLASSALITLTCSLTLAKTTIFNINIPESLLDIFGSALKICSFLGLQGVGELSYLTLATAPLHLVYASIESYQRLKLLATAIKAHDLFASVFFVFLSIDSFGSALGDISRAFVGGMEFIGIPNNPIFPIVSSLVLPIMMMVLSGISATIDSVALGENIYALHQFNKKTRNSSAIEVLEYLRGPQKRADEIDERKIAQHKIDSWKFEQYHSNRDFDLYQKKITEFLAKVSDKPLTEEELKEANILIWVGKGEIHRKIINRIAGIAISLLTMAAGIMLIINSNKYLLQASIISITASGTNIGKFVIHRVISKERYAKIERLIARLIGFNVEYAA